MSAIVDLELNKLKTPFGGKQVQLRRTCFPPNGVLFVGALLESRINHCKPQYFSRHCFSTWTDGVPLKGISQALEKVEITGVHH